MRPKLIPKRRVVRRCSRQRGNGAVKGYPLDFILIAGKYNSRHIRSLLTRIQDHHGLPHKAIYFEQGVWASRFIDGDYKSRHSMNWRETENGLRERGINLDVRHATTPRAKPIEALFHILQDRQRSEPGFVGFNERSEKMERMQEFIARARKHKEHPGNEMLEMGQWVKNISKTLGEFMHDPQNGKMIGGYTPSEFWQAQINSRPQVKLPDDCRYLLSTHKKPVKVRQKGIVLDIGGQRLLYCNEQTGALIGREVLAFYNIDNPEILTVSDMKRQNYFTVKRISLPAMSATKEQFREVNAQRNGHMKAAKTLYGEIQHPLRNTISRDSQHDDATKELGRFHNGEVEKFKTEQSAATRKLRKIQNHAAASGVNISQNIRNPDRVLKGIEREQEIRDRIARKTKPEGTAAQ